MPELRKDPVTGRWVVIADHQALGPGDLSVPSTQRRFRHCSLCSASGDEPGSGGTLPVVPDADPVSGGGGTVVKRGRGLYDVMNSSGVHELVVETAEHDLDLADLPEERIERLVGTVRARMRELGRDEEVQHVIAYREHGVGTGARNEHPHTHVVALPVVPPRVAEELRGSRQYHEYWERCVFCDLVGQDLKERSRVVSENGACVVLAPFASSRPFEVWVVPRNHEADFLASAGGADSALAAALKDALRRIKRILNDPPYTLSLHSAPAAYERPASYHWHFEVSPSLAPAAGFERTSGCAVNPVMPEDAAAWLREAA